MAAKYNILPYLKLITERVKKMKITLDFEYNGMENFSEDVNSILDEIALKVDEGITEDKIYGWDGEELGEWSL